jgi:hypothetical protein
MNTRGEQKSMPAMKCRGRQVEGLQLSAAQEAALRATWAEAHVRNQGYAKCVAGEAALEHACVFVAYTACHAALLQDVGKEGLVDWLLEEIKRGMCLENKLASKGFAATAAAWQHGCPSVNAICWLDWAAGVHLKVGSLDTTRSPAIGSDSLVRLGHCLPWQHLQRVLTSHGVGPADSQALATGSTAFGKSTGRELLRGSQPP